MNELAAMGVNIIAPPTHILVDLDATARIVPSVYAREAKAARLDIITWTLERSGPLATGGAFYYQGVDSVTNNGGDVFNLLDVLARAWAYWACSRIGPRRSRITPTASASERALRYPE